MDRGTTALVRTRRTIGRGAVVRTGDELPQQGELDALHKQLERSRDRVYRADPPLPPAEVSKFEALWQDWFTFYTVPHSRGPTAQERLLAFHNAANGWEKYLDQRDSEHGTSSLWKWGLGATALIGLIGLAAKGASSKG